MTETTLSSVAPQEEFSCSLGYHHPSMSHSSPLSHVPLITTLPCLNSSPLSHVSTHHHSPMSHSSPPFHTAGVDESVHVVYKPVKRLREQGGLLSRTVTYTYRQDTELHNTRTETACVSFTDQLPRSEDEKLKVRGHYRGVWSDVLVIQVTLVDPVLVKPKAGAPPPNPHLTAANNILWRLELAPGETRTVTIHYAIEFPANKRVDGL